ncbi:MAG: GNAT family N-acetyltransferase [Calditrichaceae bacterium]
MASNHLDIDQQKQKQILKLVTNSFYKELVNYGIEQSDIVTVSVNLLDLVTEKGNVVSGNNRYYNNIFSIQAVDNHWNEKNCLCLEKVSIEPLKINYLGKITEWLKAPEIRETFIGFFPKTKDELKKYLFDDVNHCYFAIFYEKALVGFIGADTIDRSFQKIEMKKLIGKSEFRSRGIGKIATFLFLYHTFRILNFNKVYIHSLDTNIKNINLNSKFGFELEGILYKDAYLEGVYRDVLRMGLLKTKWEKIFSNPKN